MYLGSVCQLFLAINIVLGVLGSASSKSEAPRAGEYEVLSELR